jgi:hypothetical protein
VKFTARSRAWCASPLLKPALAHRRIDLPPDLPLKNPTSID